MYHAITSAAYQGMDSFLVQVEVDVSTGLPCMDMVGCLASEVKETKERVRIGIKNSGYEMPVKRVTISLSPADLKKDGSGFDLPVAVGILCATYMKEEQTKHKPILIMGELGLDGEIKPLRGILPMLLMAAENKITECIIPFDNRKEASNVKDMELYPVKSLREAFEVYLSLLYREDVVNIKDKITEDIVNNIGEIFLNRMKYSSLDESVNAYEQLVDQFDNKITYDIDFAQLYGQDHAKRAALIAGAGFHNLLLFGPPGSGKSMIAQRIPTVMPTMTYEESIAVTKIYSVAGILDKNITLVTKRPYISPHHSVTASALIGGGRIPRPGMITLAHNGVLFLDEIPEFGRAKLDLLREPLEEKKIRITRNMYSCEYDADFMLVAAMNPCPCGYYPDRNKCNCTPAEIEHYLGKLSGPFLDRIDLSVEVGRMSWDEIENSRKIDVDEGMGAKRQQYSSETMRNSIEKARKRQLNRAGKYNAQLSSDEVKQYCNLSNQANQYLQMAFERLQLSVRALHRIERVALTIADLEESDVIEQSHISEAIMYHKGLDAIRRRKL